MSILADITDFAALGRLSSRDICFYLIKHKWVKVAEAAGVVIFDSPTKVKVRLWVPLKGGTQEDYVVSMGKLIRTLSSYEARSQLDILEDFDVFSVGDVVRVGSEDPFDRHSSSVSFDVGVDLINKAKQILLVGSSVATASKPRAFFGSRKPARAQEFIKNVRLGQTERGSYIVKVISPLPLEFEDKNLTLPSIPEKTPFERLAVESTFRGMIALNDVVAEIEKKGKFYFDPFLERVIDGVNADLCEAIIGKKEHEQLPLNFSVAWSPAFKIDISSDLTERVYFSANSYQYIREAAEQFRRIEPEEVSIVGYVIKLHKESKVGDGDITLATTISGKNRKITIYLESAEYRKATEAHDKWLEVEATGVLEKGKLVSVTSFSLLNGMFD